MSAPTASTLGQQASVPTPLGLWLQSLWYDLSLFILSPLLGLAWLLTAPGLASMLVVIAVLGIPHYLSTFTFYFWEDNWHYHRSRWVAFFLGPAGIVLAVVVVLTWRIPYILQLVVYGWNAFHVARQSCGILSLYRHRAGIFDPQQKARANTAIMASSGCLACWNLLWNPPIYRPLSRLASVLPSLLWLGFGAVAVVAILRLGIALWQRHQRGQTPCLPELAFLGTSLLLFHPFVWVREVEQATTGMLMGHFIQYLGMVWLLHRRKFTISLSTKTPRWLVRLSGSYCVLLPVCLATGSGYLLLYYLSTLWALTRAFDAALFMLVFLHFYLDGLFWAFKVPHVRRSIGPYLVTGRLTAVPQ